MATDDSFARTPRRREPPAELTPPSAATTRASGLAPHCPGPGTLFQRCLLRRAGARAAAISREPATGHGGGVSATDAAPGATGAHRHIHQSPEHLRRIVDAAHEFAILSMDLDRRIASWSNGAERLLGYAAAEMLGQTADVIFVEEDRAARACEQEANTARREGRAADERWHRRKDGTRFWGSGVMTPMRDDAGAIIGFVKVLRDQTEARESQEALERSQRDLWQAVKEMEQARLQAEAARRAKDHFLAVLSHELRTPLTPALFAVQSLARRSDLPEGVAESLEMVRRNIQLEAHFIDDLLDLTRIENGKLELQRAPIDLHEAVRLAVQTVQPDLAKKEQRLVVELDATQTALHADAARLQQVFWNLLKNASKFSPAGSEIRVHSFDEDSTAVVVRVVDQGVGFEPEAEHRIFDAFQQAEPSVSRRFGGLGLGLAISKAVVEAHGGTLTARSEGGNKGATFTVRLGQSRP